VSSEDYPGLIAKGQSIDTIAYGAVMIAYNWPKGTERYRRVAEFVDRFFSHFPDFQKPPRHPTWREVNLAADLPGWKRFPEAQTWLDSHQNSAFKQADFDAFLAQRTGASSAALSSEQREEIFREFLKWHEERQR
jgi:hypothetical protein